MKTCPRCGAANPDDFKFCQQCGQAVESGRAAADWMINPSPEASASPPDATVRWTGQPPPPHRKGAEATGAALRRAVSLDVLFGNKQRLVIGRAPDCDVCLAHPTISRYHALLERLPEGLRLRDLQSVNGIFVSGQRITEPVFVREQEHVGIGPFLFAMAAGVLYSLDNSRSLRLEARHLERTVRLRTGQDRKLLDDINLVVEPGEFVSLLGPSGSGKSTLMDCLNGRRRATGGRVIANGEDFYRHFDSFRQSLGYVPQKDIVHTGLTVRRALYYTARLRLPPDTSREELEARVEEVIRQMELSAHRDTLVANLSGGQIKRVSLGAELLAEPSLLYIDEATSGLDAGTEARMMRLFRELADEGRSVLCITHNVDSVERCHLVLVLARGRLIYYGPPAEAPGYFGVSRISEIYDKIATRDLAEWQARFESSALHREYVQGRLASPSTPAKPAGADNPASEPPRFRLPAFLSDSKLMERFQPLADYFRKLEAGRLSKLIGRIVEGWNQFTVLTRREVELIRGDRRSLRLLLLQAPVVAVFLLIGFIGKEFRAPMPLLRRLNQEERRTLVVMRALGQMIDDDKPLTDEQKTALKRIRVQVAGIPAQLDGNGIVRILRQLQSDKLTEAQRQTLQEATFTLDVDGDPVTVTAAELVRSWRQFHDSDIPDRILKIPGPVVPYAEGVNPRYTYILLFILVMIVLWFGCNNAAKEIVKEGAIYGRERAVNLGIAPYLASKFLVLGVITTLHALALMLILYGVLEGLAALRPGHSVPDAGHMLAYAPQLGVLALLGLTGVALGLLLSACVSTPDRANALLPYVLIPQMILGGGILTVTGGLLYLLAVTLSPVYWAYRAVHLGASQLAGNFPGHAPYADGVLWPCLALAAQLAVLLAATFVAMRCKDV
jgi:ABC-type multidrug transport system ATPase subunit/ribosomal protein L25 (general stress protein Ctc)